MNIVKIVVRNVKRRRLSTSLTAASVALGVALFVAIGVLRQASEQGFQRTAGICDTIVGAKGDSLQLSLNTLYHMGFSAGNISLDSFNEIRNQEGVAWAAPIALGDSYRSHRIVGVSSEFFEQVKIAGSGSLSFSDGRPFDFSTEQFVEEHEHLFGEQQAGHDHEDDEHVSYRAVIGANVATKLSLKVGDKIVPTHGVEKSTEHHHDAASEIVGILEATGTPIDRAIYIPIIAYYKMEGHAIDREVELEGTRDARGISAIMLSTKSGYYRQQIYRSINNRLDAMAVFPSIEMRKLFKLIGSGDMILRIISLLVVVVALIGVLVSLYNAMGARRKEFAILRALGASRRLVMTIVSLESAIIAFLGAIFGTLLASLAALVLATELHAFSGVTINVSLGVEEIYLIVIVTLAGAFAGLIPALEAYRTEAAKQLSSNV
ncbi:MAG: ABC transporter permease [Planctomycetota bacterium]|nr:ABC transporter permease [Planctomycetota bacterium]